MPKRLPEELVSQMAEMQASGATYQEVADHFERDPGTVYRCISNYRKRCEAASPDLTGHHHWGPTTRTYKRWKIVYAAYAAA